MYNVHCTSTQTNTYMAKKFTRVYAVNSTEWYNNAANSENHSISIVWRGEEKLFFYVFVQFPINIRYFLFFTLPNLIFLYGLYPRCNLLLLSIKNCLIFFPHCRHKWSHKGCFSCACTFVIFEINRKLFGNLKQSASFVRL